MHGYSVYSDFFFILLLDCIWKVIRVFKRLAVLVSQNVNNLSSYTVFYMLLSDKDITNTVW